MPKGGRSQDGPGERAAGSRWARAAALGGPASVFLAAVGTHAADCWARHDWVFLILGLVMWPLGALHGLALWVGLAR